MLPEGINIVFCRENPTNVDHINHRAAMVAEALGNQARNAEDRAHAEAYYRNPTLEATGHYVSDADRKAARDAATEKLIAEFTPEVGDDEERAAGVSRDVLDRGIG